MKAELKCPVCQNNLHEINMIVSTCTNDKCKLWGSSIPNLVLKALIDTEKKLDIVMDGLKRIEKLTEPSYKNRNLEALALAVNAFSGEIIEQINQRNNNE